MVSIEIDGKKLEAENGEMLIAVADRAGITIPRFCYHKKLSISANCRMCLVDVEKAPKPLPACATAVMDGMKVFTQSKRALDAQKAVMEFLLINHPLDCPICDQGGECELQDVSMGFGEDISRYTEGKRSVDDENLGSLIATDMTRCIHCTRCVRFGEEVAGLRELGVTDRGETMRIGTFVENSLTSEVSGNIIDLCPVGALTSKPFRFKARAWELKQTSSIAPHDCFGSNIFIHTRRDDVMRVVPKENEAINETWISDRDRFSYPALQHPERLSDPLIKRHGQWEVCDWLTALNFAADKLKSIKEKQGAEQIAALASPNSTLEEFYLLQKLMRGLGSNNIDHRLRETDAADQNAAPLCPGMISEIETIEKQQHILLVGTNIHHEVPLAGIRVRTATRHGAKVFAINSLDAAFNFPVEEKMICQPNQLVNELAQVAKLFADATKVSTDMKALLKDVKVGQQAQIMADQLKESENSMIILGLQALHHPQAAKLRALADLIAELSQSQCVKFTDGANSAGAWISGAIPHRDVAGQAIENAGLSANEALQKKLNAYLLLNVEPELDCANPTLANDAMKNADFVMALTPFHSEYLKEIADLLLPITPFTEMPGTFVNLAGQWQSFNAVVSAKGNSRPGWKVLRVLANLLELDNFEYDSSQTVCDEIKRAIEKHPFTKQSVFCPESLSSEDIKIQRLTEWPLYAVDNVVRRSVPLQASATNERVSIHLCAALAERLRLMPGKLAKAKQGKRMVTLPVIIDERLPDNTVLIPGGCKETVLLTDPFGEIEVKL